MFDKFERCLSGDTLDLERQGIADELFPVLIEYLKYLSNTPLLKVIKVNLKWNRISCKGIKPLAEFLKTNKTLTELDLSNNDIDDEGISALADALTINDTLLGLDLSDNPFTDKSVKVLAKALESNDRLERCSVDIYHPQFAKRNNFRKLDIQIYRNKNQSIAWLNLYNTKSNEANDALMSERSQEYKELQKYLPDDLSSEICEYIRFKPLAEIPPNFFKKRVAFFLQSYEEECKKEPQLCGRKKNFPTSSLKFFRLNQGKPSSKGRGHRAYHHLLDNFIRFEDDIQKSPVQDLSKP